MLFDRSPRGLVLTTAGQVLYDAAGAVLEQMQELENGLRQLGDPRMDRYTHGYSTAEARRLTNQANGIADLLHADSQWPSGSHVLEAGCGVGAQTAIIAARNLAARFTCVDLSAASIERAKMNTQAAGLSNVTFAVADLARLPYPDGHFDHVLVCFVLEHLPDPALVLKEMMRVLTPGGSVTVIEGDHGSAYFNPDNAAARHVIAAQVELQRANGGDANIGRRLHPLLAAAGFTEIEVVPRIVYVDDGNPERKREFVINTFTAMIEGISKRAVERGLRTETQMRRGIEALKTTARSGGTFNYTFFRARALRLP